MGAGSSWGHKAFRQAAVSGRDFWKHLSTLFHPWLKPWAVLPTQYPNTHPKFWSILAKFDCRTSVPRRLAAYGKQHLFCGYFCRKTFGLLITAQNCQSNKQVSRNNSFDSWFIWKFRSLKRAPIQPFENQECLYDDWSRPGASSGILWKEGKYFENLQLFN